MAQILIVTESPDGEGEVVYRERVGSVHLEAPHYGPQLVERVNWAVRDAQELERRQKLDRAAGPQRLRVA
jgi:hypothetical protein